MKLIKQQLSDNSAEVHMERMVVIAIAFIAGALMVAAVWFALSKYFPEGMESNIHDWMN
jgi:hypothetical protein